MAKLIGMNVDFIFAPAARKDKLEKFSEVQKIQKQVRYDLEPEII